MELGLVCSLQAQRDWVEVLTREASCQELIEGPKIRLSPTISDTADVHGGGYVVTLGSGGGLVNRYLQLDSRVLGEAGATPLSGSEDVVLQDENLSTGPRSMMGRSPSQSRPGSDRRDLGEGFIFNRK